MYYWYFIILLPRQALSIIASTGRVVRPVRAELSATGRAVHGPSCPRAELSGYQEQYRYIDK